MFGIASATPSPGCQEVTGFFVQHSSICQNCPPHCTVQIHKNTICRILKKFVSPDNSHFWDTRRKWSVSLQVHQHSGYTYVLSKPTSDSCCQTKSALESICRLAMKTYPVNCCFVAKLNPMRRIAISALQLIMILIATFWLWKLNNWQCLPW